jgi:hypothetical protein
LTANLLNSFSKLLHHISFDLVHKITRKIKTATK